MHKIISIQQERRDDGVLPYPFHIGTGETDRGVIGQQNLWQGTPERLAGFQADKAVQRVDLDLPEFLADPEKAVGMYPVVICKGGGMAGFDQPIASVEVREDFPESMDTWESR